MYVSVFWLMKFVFVAWSIFYVDPPHFHLLFLQSLEKYKLVTRVRAHLIGKKGFSSVKRCEASLRQKCKVPACLILLSFRCNHGKKKQKTPNLHFLEPQRSANNHHRVCLCGAILVQLWLYSTPTINIYSIPKWFKRPKLETRILCMAQPTLYLRPPLCCCFNELCRL